MKKNMFVLLSAFIFTNSLTVTHANQNVLECPDSNRITVMSDVGPPPIWFAPKLASSLRYGIGYGGMEPGPFLFSFPLSGMNNWICVYGSHMHASLTKADTSHFSVPLGEILKKIPDEFNYGFLMYEGKY